MDKRRTILAYASRLDKIAEEVENNFTAYDLTQKQAQDIVYQMDSLADRMMESHGIDPQALSEGREALVLDRDSDEGHIDTFDGKAVLERDDDDQYVMDHFEGGSNSDEFSHPIIDGIDTDLVEASDDDDDEECTCGKNKKKDDDDDDDDSKESSSNWWEESKKSSTKADYWD